MHVRAETRNGEAVRIVSRTSQAIAKSLPYMPNYLLYYMNPISGHIDRRETLHAGDDVAAVHLLQSRQFDVPVERGRDGRKVSRQDGPPSPLRGLVEPTRAASPEPAD